MTRDWIIGLDIGGTKTAVVAGGTRGEILRREQFPSETSRGFDDMFSRILAAIGRMAGEMQSPPRAVSVAVGGPLDVLNGIVLSPPNLPGWSGIHLKEMLSGRLHVPVFVEHDGNAGALAEWYFGAGKGCRSIVFMTMGTGIGAGLILDGRLYRGASDVAGEIGHVRVAEEGPDCYGKSGSLEGYGSGTGLSRIARTMFPSISPDEASPAGLREAWKQGSPRAQDVFGAAARGLGRGLAIVADTLNPERIILGGLGMRLWDALVVPALRVYEREALPDARKACRVVPAQLGERIGDLASLCAAYDQGNFLDPVIASEPKQS